MAHLDSVPFLVRACVPADAGALLALQGSCGCAAQRAVLDEAALLTATAAGLELPLAWVAQVSSKGLHNPNLVIVSTLVAC